MESGACLDASVCVVFLHLLASMAFVFVVGCITLLLASAETGASCNQDCRNLPKGVDFNTNTEHHELSERNLWPWDRKITI